MATGAQGVGRPRDERIDRELEHAVRGLLAEVGYAALSMDAVASRAGVSKAAIYRRHRSKAELVFTALFAGVTGSTGWPDTGTFVGDLTVAMDELLAVLTEPATRAATPGLLADLTSGAGPIQHLTDTILAGDVDAFGAVVDRAVARGETAPGQDVRLLYVTGLGALFGWLFLLQWEPDPDLPRRVAVLVARAARADQSSEEGPAR